jgi:hypothetical protein
MDFKTAVENAQANLSNLAASASSPEEASRWMRTLYAAYSERFLHDNAQIWANGRIMIPFALSAFGVYVGLRHPSTAHTLLLGFGSSALIAIWLINAENHRAFQNKSMAWIVAIERAIGVTNPLPPKVPDDPFNRLLSGGAAVQWLIRAFCFAIPLLWLVIIVVRVASGSR